MSHATFERPKKRGVRRSVFSCEPRYRVLRAIHARAVRGLHHAGLSVLLRAQWHLLRAHSSWSRA